MSNNVKHKGQVFTPNTIVELMLDKIGYIDDNLNHKYIFEPSFGDGAFLCTIINRILIYATRNKLTRNEILGMLDCVYGIEIDEELYAGTINKLNFMLSEYDLAYDWPHLYNVDTLKYNPDIKFDYIVGNPPYVKIQNLNLETRQYLIDNYSFCAGNTDLYIAFFEKCIPMLKNNGQLAFITPNSYFKNTSQKSFRKYLIENNYVSRIIDYGSYKVFADADTYTAITFICNNKKDDCIHYQLMLNVDNTQYSVIIKNELLDNSSWSFPSNDELDVLNDNRKLTHKISDACIVQHGISTNADAVYVITPEHFDEFEATMLRPVIKASTLNKANKIIFPYQWNKKEKRYDVLPEDLMKKKYPKTYAYLLKHKDALFRRDMEKGALWYQYARSQGLNNANTKKIVIKHVINTDGHRCCVEVVDSNTLVYSGMYIIVNDNKLFDDIKDVLESTEFYKYACITGKNMANGYKSINTKIIKEFRYQ